MKPQYFDLYADAIDASKDSKYYIGLAQDAPGCEPGTKWYAVADVRTVDLTEDKSWYEIIPNSKPAHPHFDVDGISDHAPTPDEIEAVILKTRELLGRIGIENAGQITVLSGSRPQEDGTWKASLHIKYDATFRSGLDMKQAMKHAVDGVDLNVGVFHIDEKVYTEKRLMRIYGQSKLSDDGYPLVALPQGAPVVSWTDTLVGVYGDFTGRHLTWKIPRKPRTKKVQAIDGTPPFATGIAPACEVSYRLQYLDPNTSGKNGWFKAAVLAKCYGVPYETFDAWSKLGGSRYDGEKNRQIWDDITTEDNLVGMGSLIQSTTRQGRRAPPYKSASLPWKRFIIKEDDPRVSITRGGYLPPIATDNEQRAPRLRCIRALEGSGKTHGIKHLITTSGSGKRFLMVSPRRTFADMLGATFARLGFVSYKDTADITYADRVICSPESMKRLSDLPAFDYVIVDEAESVMRACTVSSTMGKGKRGIDNLLLRASALVGVAWCRR